MRHTYLDIESAVRRFAQRESAAGIWKWSEEKADLTLLYFISGYEGECGIQDAIEIVETVMSEAIHGEWENNAGTK